MTYLYTPERGDYTDFATGRVFYSLPGRTAFPVRLASEMFQRCVALCEQQGGQEPYVLYDPCCGGASLLSSVTCLHWHALSYVVGSDIDQEALSLAERNLALLTIEGMEHRMIELQTLYQRFAKPAHAEALDSARNLYDQLKQLSSTHPVTTQCFVADATRQQAVQNHLPYNGRKVDIVMMDIPYGSHSTWRSSDAEARDPVSSVLMALSGVLSLSSVVAIAAPKQYKIAHEHYQRLAHFTIGKRRIVFLSLRGNPVVA